MSAYCRWPGCGLEVGTEGGVPVSHCDDHRLQVSRAMLKTIEGAELALALEREKARADDLVKNGWPDLRAQLREAREERDGSLASLAIEKDISLKTIASFERGIVALTQERDEWKDRAIRAGDVLCKIGCLGDWCGRVGRQCLICAWRESEKERGK